MTGLLTTDHYLMERGPIAEINLKAIANNLRIAKKITKNKPVIAVVKADAYGHGAIEVSNQLVKEGVPYLAVAYTSEAAALRHAGIKAPVIVLFDKYDIEDYFRYDLIPVIHDLKTAKSFSKEAKKRKQFINVHVKIDTGMGRLGFNNKDIVENISGISRMDSIRIKGLMSHFSDADLSDRSFAFAQIERFNNIRTALIKKGIKPLLCHMANSAAVMSLPESHLDAVRPGLMLYGYSPMHITFESYHQSPLHSPLTKGGIKEGVNYELKPAMTVKTKILSLRRLKKGTPVSYARTFITKRDSLIAVLPVGYADGYIRAFSNNSYVLVRGKRAPVVGRICMDTTMVDVTDVKGVAEKDEVILLGRQRADTITAPDLAARAGTISYEILTTLGNKARKVYLGRH